MPSDKIRENNLDLHGLTAQEAVSALYDFVRHCLLENYSKAVVIHGHGSGVLKNAVRSECAHISRIKSFRSGYPSEGGDAVTVLEL